jgi:hypothetical protein
MKIQDPVAYVICMYQEYDSVITTLNTIRDNYANAYTVIVQSKNDSLNEKWNTIYNLSDEIIVLPNLAKEYNMIPNTTYFQNSKEFFGQVVCHAGCRNASKGFSALINKKFKYLVGLTGDTKITKVNAIHEAGNNMHDNKLVLGCAKAYGQYFTSNNSASAYNLTVDRYQDSFTTDFVNTLYIINGEFFNETKCLSNIEITNTMTTEQCFGDEFLKHLPKDELLKRTFLLNSNSPGYCYGFDDGIEYHSEQK